MDEMFNFRRNANIANLCKEWDGMWAACHNDKEKLMRLVLMQQSAPYFADFCYRGYGLSKEYCLKEFSDYINGRVFHDCDQVEGYTYGMFIDQLESVYLRLDVSQFLWCNNTNVIIPNTRCPILYVSNNSDINIVMEGFNHVKIYLFDESKVTIQDADDTCSATIYKYSDKCNVKYGKFCISKRIKEFNKELRL